MNNLIAQFKSIELMGGEVGEETRREERKGAGRPGAQNTCRTGLVAGRQPFCLVL